MIAADRARRPHPAVVNGDPHDRTARNPTLEQALGVFARAYENRAQWKGQPAIFHPLRLMLTLDRDDERIAALFHDLCHDCKDWSPARMAGEGFPASLTEAVDALTRRDGEDRIRYLQRLSANDLARRVKLAELVQGRHAMPPPPHSPEQIERLALYAREIPMLETATQSG